MRSRPASTIHRCRWPSACRGCSAWALRRFSMMAQTRRAGVFEPPSDGERLERARRRRKLLIVGALAAVGGIGGGIVGGYEADRLFDLGHPWPPMLCLALAAILLVAVAIGKFALRGQIDEVERLAKLTSTHVG